MAITASGIFYPAFRDALSATGAIDWSGETGKIAMFTNSITPNFNTDTAYGTAPYNANEVTDTLSSYVAGGQALTTTTFSVSSQVLKYTGDNSVWASSSISNARGALYYTNVSGSKQALFLVNFGADYSTTNGTFTIQWNAAGIVNIQLS